MNSMNDAARQKLIHQMFTARTLQEVEAATVALKQWRQEHPDDYGIVDGGEVLSHRRDYAEWKLANPEEWAAEQEAERRAIAAHQPERDRMLRDALNARSGSQLARAEQELYQWITDYPEDVGRDLGIIEALEQVVTRQEALAVRDEPALMGQAA